MADEITRGNICQNTTMDGFALILLGVVTWHTPELGTTWNTEYVLACH